MDKLDTLAAIATNLTSVLEDEDRYQRLLDALHIAIPFDAAALLRVQGDILIPLAAKGLTPDALGREYSRKLHPRLDVICDSRGPVLFSKDSSLPDPFDGLIALAPEVTQQIHACLGCPLYVRDKLVGVLTADALDPTAFDNLPHQYLNVIGLLAGVQLHTADLLGALEQKAIRHNQIASDLMQDAQMQRGREIIGNSSVMVKLKKEIELVAKSDFTTLVLGETGVGKELVARAIHNHSNRREKVLLYLNCAALPENLAESELFGHLKGSFTGATTDRTGKFELADGGTLFLDEIGELSLEIQAKILRAIQEGEIQKLGSEEVVHVNVRLLAATNRSLESEVAAGRFRADLFHRLNVYPVNVPPLRDRKDDIALLAGFFAERSLARLGIRQVRISQEALDLLLRYGWPGNVRELENIISRSILKASAESDSFELVVLRPEHLAGDLGSPLYTSFKEETALSTPPVVRGSLREEVDGFQIRLIQAALENNNGNWAGAARELKINRSNLHHLAIRLGIKNSVKRRSNTSRST